MVSGDLAVVVLIERSEVTVDGVSDPQRWELRTTQVPERRGETWVRLHQHADPLIDRRSPADTFTIARGERGGCRAVSPSGGGHTPSDLPMISFMISVVPP